jgi:hypothetical protein
MGADDFKKACRAASFRVPAHERTRLLQTYGDKMPMDAMVGDIAALNIAKDHAADQERLSTKYGDVTRRGKKIAGGCGCSGSGSVGGSSMDRSGMRVDADQSETGLTKGRGQAASMSALYLPSQLAASAPALVLPSVASPSKSASVSFTASPSPAKSRLHQAPPLALGSMRDLASMDPETRRQTARDMLTAKLKTGTARFAM